MIGPRVARAWPAQANMRGQGPRAARASQAENERSEFSACSFSRAYGASCVIPKWRGDRVTTQNTASIPSKFCSTKYSWCHRVE